MLKGTDLAAQAGNPEHAAAIEAMLQQLLIVMVKRSGGQINVTAAEIDGTGQETLAMQLLPDRHTFCFTVKPKS
jgi:hypothetical protein